MSLLDWTLYFEKYTGLCDGVQLKQDGCSQQNTISRFAKAFDDDELGLFHKYRMILNQSGLKTLCMIE